MNYIVDFVGAIWLLNQIAVVMFPALEELKCRAVKRVRVMGEEQVTGEEVNKMLGSSYYMHGLE